MGGPIGQTKKLDIGTGLGSKKFVGQYGRKQLDNYSKTIDHNDNQSESSSKFFEGGAFDKKQSKASQAPSSSVKSKPIKDEDHCCKSKRGMFIDMFGLKILALLMCKDTLENKAGLFMDTIIGRAGIHCGRSSIAVGNSRLKKAFKYLIFFSEIFPKYY